MIRRIASRPPAAVRLLPQAKSVGIPRTGAVASVQEAQLSMPRKTWERYGWHNERGHESVRRTLELIAGHDLNHLDQILAIKKKYGW